MNSNISLLERERTLERPETAIGVIEKDMRVRKTGEALEDAIFARYPLLGSFILKPETVDKLNANARECIDWVLKFPKAKPSLHAEMQIALALINYARNWNYEENSHFWDYISLQFGYRDTNGAVARLLQSCLENAMKRNNRLFLEDANGRAFKSTVLIHALSPRKSWMLLFDFLFDFYKSNLNWRVIPNDPLIAVMIRSLQQKLSRDNQEEIELEISSKVYSFQEGIWKLVLYRPVFTRGLFERLIGKIDSLVNSEVKPAKTYEEQLCEEWFKEKITAISNSKKTERQAQNSQREVALDYSRIRAKFILKDETDVQLVLPDIRLKSETVGEATLTISCDGSEILQKRLSWYGNELGKTLRGVSISLPRISDTGSTLNLRIRIQCGDEIIFDSADSMNRNELIFYGSTEIGASQIRRDHYTLVIADSANLVTENTDVEEIDSLKNIGLKAYFLELNDGYVISVDGRLVAFDSENGTDIRVIVPGESASLPTVSLTDREAYLVYRESTCSIILGKREYAQRFILLIDGEKIELDSLPQSENGLVYIVPLDGEKDTVRLQVLDLTAERLLFDRTFMVMTEADCSFNRAFYYGASDYIGAEYSIDIDDFHEVLPFSQEDSEVRISFRQGELHMEIPKVVVQETSGTWLQDQQAAWYIGSIPQNSFLKVTKPEKAEIQFLIDGKDILYDGRGLVTIGNVLQSYSGDNGRDAVDVEMRVNYQNQTDSYTLAKVYLKERFLKRPEFWTEESKLYWDHGGAFIGNAGRDFALLLIGTDDKSYGFKFTEETEFISLPESMDIGNYRYEISIQTGGLFKRSKEIVATGDCTIGDKNLLRFMNRRIAIEFITDESREKEGHIPVRPCYIDQIQFRGMEETSEGYCPVYSGILFSIGNRGERYEYSHDVHTNKRGITKMMVNPVRIVYISDMALCITDPDGDGLYYYNYYDHSLGFTVYALTDYECTKANKRNYSNADLYLYRVERV